MSIARIECVVGELVEHLVDQPVDVGLVVPEAVEHRVQRGVGDLQLPGRQVEPEGDLVRSDQRELFVFLSHQAAS